MERVEVKARIRDADITEKRTKRASQCPKCESYAFYNGRCFDCNPSEKKKKIIQPEEKDDE